MATSTENRPPREGASCRHRDAHSEALLKKYGHDCPSDLSFWCANGILADIRKLEFECRAVHESHDKRLRAEFGGILERNLARSYDCEGIQVIWSLDEKSIEVHDIARDDVRQETINRVILELNAEYRSHPLLWRLVGFALGRSHVFSVEAREEGACLVVRPLMCLSLEKGSEEWRIPVPLNSGCSVSQLLSRVRALSDQAEPELIDDIKANIQRQIDEWIPNTWAAWPQQEFEVRLRDDSERQDASEDDFQQLFREAARHIALISIYQACNDFSATSYIMAPTLQGQCESSLVICWPQAIGEGNLNLLYLIQMILGQNATAILGEQEKRRQFRQLAVAAYKIGHPMKHRVGPVRRAVGGLKDAAEDGRLTMDNARHDAAMALIALRSVEALGHILDVLSRAIGSGEEERIFLADGKSEWRDTAPYFLSQELSRIERQVNAVNDPEVHLVVRETEAPLSIAPWITSGTRRVRPSNIFYDEVFNELLTNASRNGYRLPGQQQVAIRLSMRSICDANSGKSRQCLVLSNDCQETTARKRIGFNGDDWIRWDMTDTEAVGGLFFLANLLECTNMGAIYMRIRSQRDDVGQFEIGLWLAGMPEGGSDGARQGVERD